MSVDDLILRVGAPLMVFTLTALARWFSSKQREQDYKLQGQQNEQIRQDEHIKNSDVYTKERFGAIETRLNSIEHKLDALPEKIARQIQGAG